MVVSHCNFHFHFLLILSKNSSIRSSREVMDISSRSAAVSAAMLLHHNCPWNDNGIVTSMDLDLPFFPAPVHRGLRLGNGRSSLKAARITTGLESLIPPRTPPE